MLGQEIHTDSPIIIWIWTPFFKAVSAMAEKERNYESYTDDEIMNYLKEDSVEVYLTYGDASSQKLDIGYFETVVIKDGNAVYTSKRSAYEPFSLSGIEIRNVNDYNKFKDNVVNLMVVGSTGEKNISIDLAKYR